MKSKKILGLDIGVSSIGWALIRETNDKRDIIALGTRIIPMDKENNDEFIKGNQITINQKRTAKRTQRKGYYRYVLRRKALTAELKKHNMFDENLFNLPQLTLWSLRSTAVTNKIKLTELGRVLYHLNQKRGYKSSRTEENIDKKDTEYVADLKSRWEKLKDERKTIGQKFFEELSNNQFYRTKQQVFPREAYIDEYNAIMKKQQEFYPNVLTNELIDHIRDNIIYFQRKLKSQKGLVSICEFEGFYTSTQNGKEVFTGPKVAHRSNPIFQVEKIWESINNISIKDTMNNEFPITLEQKQKIFEFLNDNEKITKKQLFNILGINEQSGYIGNKMLDKGIQGNLTRVWIKNALQNQELEDRLLQFNINVTSSDEPTHLIDRNTGEVLNELPKEEIAEDFINEPLYKLWHLIYSIKDINECKKAIINNFNIDEQIAERLAKIDFARLGYGNKSTKAIRKILPYLMIGNIYSDAASYAGYNHSFAFTRNEIHNRTLLDKLPLLRKNALRQPVVEKILNQMIHIVNDIIDENRGWITKEERGNGDFEIRIELARELKQSREERNETFKNLNKIERENNEIKKKLIELGIRATRNNIIKYRLFNEISTNRINATCVYTGRIFSLSDVLNGDNVDVEHIIPRSLLFDDSQSNKTLTFRQINQQKGNNTAYDYMASKGEEVLNNYIERVNNLYREKIITRTKLIKLLTPSSKIPKSMIERQLKETQYVSRKAREILQQISKNVWCTTGQITSLLRRLWGWDEVLMNLQIQRIKKIIPDPLAEGITEIVEWESDNGQKNKKEVIKGWTKRDDHRHHAIDALVIACTKQSFIQRINTLSAQHTRDELYAEVSRQNNELREKLTILEKYLILQQPFTSSKVQKKVAEILISFKPGKKVATWGKRYIRKNGKRTVVQDRIIVPRGPLSEEQVYGKIKTIEKNKPLKYIFENPHLIFKPYIKELVENRLNEYNGSVKQAIASLKNKPIYLDDAESIPLEFATCYKEEYVIKYPIKDLKVKDLPFIVDKRVKKLIEARLAEHNNNEKEAFKEPVYFDINNKIPIHSVRLFTGLSAVENVRTDENGEPVAFVKPANNHHIAIYKDEYGKIIPHLCTFWHAVERKKYGIPVIIEKPSEIWDSILQGHYPELPDAFTEKLPLDEWTFITSIQQNEMFILSENELNLNNIDNKNITKCLYRVQKLSDDIVFRHHVETILDNSTSARKLRKFYRVTSMSALINLNPIKLKINRLGEITEMLKIFN